MLNQKQKQLIVEEIVHRAGQYPSAARQAIVLEINAAQLSRIKKGELEGVLSEEKWITIARKLDVNLNPAKNWVTAVTPVFSFITEQLTYCQANAVSGILCDIADIGKTHTARVYSSKNRNAVYIDCSQVKTKQKLVKRIAQEFAVRYTGKFTDVYEDLCFTLRTIENPIVILDEAGDLDAGATLEIKALWNATEGNCAWYLMGADGLEVKMNKNRDKKKVGYTEIFSRFGERYQFIAPKSNDMLQDFKKVQTQLIAKANGHTGGLRDLFAKTNGSLRRIKTEVLKQKRA